MPVALQVNCGFAPVAILELSRVPKGASRASLDKAKRCSQFQEMFSNQLLFTIPEGYYASNSPKNYSAFDHHCEFVMRCFSKKWNPQTKRQKYCSVFSSASWGCLSLGERTEHSLANCNASAK